MNGARQTHLRRGVPALSRPASQPGPPLRHPPTTTTTAPRAALLQPNLHPSGCPTTCSLSSSSLRAPPLRTGIPQSPSQCENGPGWASSSTNPPDTEGGQCPFWLPALSCPFLPRASEEGNGLTAWPAPGGGSGGPGPPPAASLTAAGPPARRFGGSEVSCRGRRSSPGEGQVRDGVPFIQFHLPGMPSAPIPTPYLCLPSSSQESPSAWLRLPFLWKASGLPQAVAHPLLWPP